MSDFKTTLRGGSWAEQVHGIGFNEVRAEACSKDGKTWCDILGLSLSASSSLNKFGNESCVLLAEMWCHRMDWYYRIWFERGKHNTFYVPNVFTQYREPECVQTVVREGLPATQSRAAETRVIRIECQWLILWLLGKCFD